MERVVCIRKVRSKYKVTLSDESEWWLSASEMRKLDIHEDASVDLPSFREKLLASQTSRGLRLAVSMLAGRPCSRSEVRRKLIVNHYSEEAADRVVARLEKEGFLDDRAFAEQWLRYRLSCRYGARRIAQELKMKGIDPAIREEVMEGLQEEDVFLQAVSLVRSRLRRNTEKAEDRRFREKVLRSLLQRGYGWDIAKKAWLQAVSELSEDDSPDIF